MPSEISETGEAAPPGAGRTKRPFRFGAQAFNASSSKEWRQMARTAESLGYSAFHLADHIFGPGRAHDESKHPIQQLAALPAMCFAAAATEHIRIGSRMFCIDYHVPATLAKEAATLDLLSDGRLELGLGAGWVKPEYQAMGIRFDPPEVRVARLAEVVELMRQQFSGEQINVKGEYVNVTDYAGVPRPVQRPGPPITIGGGSKRILTLAGKAADVVSVNWTWRSGNIDPAAMASSSASEVEKKLRWAKAAAEEAGRWDDIEIEVGTPFLFITDNGHRVAEKLSPKLGIPPEEVPDYPYALIGSVDHICEQLEARREHYGISYVTVLITKFAEDASDYEQFASVVQRLNGK
jgi:probable F420-dependent oxidoreductase